MSISSTLNRIIKSRALNNVMIIVGVAGLVGLFLFDQYQRDLLVETRLSLLENKLQIFLHETNIKRFETKIIEIEANISKLDETERVLKEELERESSVSRGKPIYDEETLFRINEGNRLFREELEKLERESSASGREQMSDEEILFLKDWRRVSLTSIPLDGLLLVR